MRKRFAALCTAVVLCSMVLLCSAAAVLDPDAVGSITITLSSKNAPVLGGSLQIYRVAEVLIDNADQKFAYISPFSGCTQPLDDLTNEQLLAEVDQLVSTRKPTPNAIVENKTGKVVFAGLPTGLYLVYQANPAPGYYAINPFFVTIPMKDGEEYRYDVEASSKMEIIPVETTAPTPPPTTWPGNKIPQTGQLKWPVPVLAAAGLGLLVIGTLLRRKREFDEA